MHRATAAGKHTKIGMDVEALLRWAYVDELSKRQSSAAEGVWDRILDYQNHGGVDSESGGTQRYSHFGLPDPDAERIEKAVSALPEMVIDWKIHLNDIAGDLAGLVSINSLSPVRSGRAQPDYGWGKAGDRALKGFFGPKGAQPLPDPRRRDVLLVEGIKTKMLVTVHAIKGTRPDWHDEQPQPGMMPSRGRGGTVAAIVGECRGKNLYTTGSYCPVTWSPSPLSLVTARVDYFAWHCGLMQLCETLCLDKFEALPPRAPRLPWINNDEQVSHVIPVVPTGRNDVAPWGTLPLKPARPRAGPPRRRQADPGSSLIDGAV